MLPGVGVFGVSELVYVLIPQLKSRGFQVRAIWGQTASEVETVAKELDVPFCTTRMDDVLLHKNVGLVFILCPPALQAQITIKALGIGKHVLCDFPGGISQTETLKMVNASLYYPSLISVLSYGLRFLPAVVHMKQLVESDFIGELLMADVSVILPAPPISEMKARYGWHCDQVMGGGILCRIGSHLIDVVQFISRQTAVRVHGIVRNLNIATPNMNGSPIHVVTADDFATFQMELSRGMLATFSLQTRTGAASMLQTITFVGKKGELVIRGGDLYGTKRGYQADGSGGKEQVLHLDAEEMSLPASASTHKRITDGLRSWILPRPQTKGLCRLIAALQESFTTALSSSESEENSDSWVKDPVATAATFPEGQIVQATIEAIRKSSLEKRWVQVQIQTEERDSNRLLSESARRTTVSF